MMPSENRKKGERAGQRPQCFGGFGRGADLGLAVGVQRRRGGDDDEEADEVRQYHADRGVDPDAKSLRCDSRLAT